MRCSTIPTERPDANYLDAFLQGARFALFALEGRLKDRGRPVPAELDEALEEFHELYAATREGIEESPTATVELSSRYSGKN